MPDYYAILGIEKNASESEIKKAYRRMALKYHPDRNKGDRQAEDKFKEIAEAYGVLIDPEKRRKFDTLRDSSSHAKKDASFHYTQEEILRDLFNNPQASAIFAELLREFGKAGLRYGPNFFSRSLLGGRGIFWGGIFIFGFPKILKALSLFSAKKTHPSNTPSFLQDLGSSIRSFLGGPPFRPQDQTQKTDQDNSTITYHLSLGKEEAKIKPWVQIALGRGKGIEKIRVKLPPTLKDGTRLRIKGKGFKKNNQQGDLQVIVHIS